MIIYRDEDGSYLSWVRHHREGFVIDWLRKPTRRRPVLHRASCDDICKSKSKKTHWTTGRHLKACGLKIGQLMDWLADECELPVEYCEHCHPQEAPSPGNNESMRLTPLEKEILDYVLEITVIHLDREQPEYEVTLANIAEYFDKTPGQLAAAVQSLLHLRLLQRGTNRDKETPIAPGESIYATTESLALEPAFQSMSRNELNNELRRLGGIPDASP